MAVLPFKFGLLAQSRDLIGVYLHAESNCSSTFLTGPLVKNVSWSTIVKQDVRGLHSPNLREQNKLNEQFARRCQSVRPRRAFTLSRHVTLTTRWGSSRTSW